MKCPIDQTNLQVTDRQGIEIDWCPTCRGVWLDRGELDKLIERSAAFAAPAARQDERRTYRDDDDRYDRRRDEGDNRPRRKKKRGFLDDIFDFD